MSLLRTLADGLRSLFRKERANQELDEELHRFLEIADFLWSRFVRAHPIHLAK
jgi:hypothetical protein